MVFKRLIKLLFGFVKDMKEWSEEPDIEITEKPKRPAESEKRLGISAKSASEIHSVWDYIKARENTQAHHLTSVIGLEWIEMREIRRRIKEQFDMEYQNERSLYPYIKTFTDLGLFECTDIGGARKWRKKNILITAQGATEKEETEKSIETRNSEEQKEAN